MNKFKSFTASSEIMDRLKQCAESKEMAVNRFIVQAVTRAIEETEKEKEKGRR